MLRALTLAFSASALAAAALGCSGAEIDHAEFLKVEKVVIGCMKAPNAAAADADVTRYAGGKIDVAPANPLVGAALREALVAWGEFEVVSADEAATTGPYKALGTTSRGYEAFGGTYMLASNNAEVIQALFDDTGADAMLFIDWTWGVSAVKGLSDGSRGLSVNGLDYNVQVRLAMVKPDGTRIWFSRAKAFSGETQSTDSATQFGLLAPKVAKVLVDDARAAVSSPD